jgi:hypothetical protein
VHSLKACRATRDFVSGGTPLGIVRQGSNEELSNRIVLWNVRACALLASMRKVDRVLGGLILAGLAAAAVIGIIFGLH